jgi:hypothetical protein
VNVEQLIDNPELYPKWVYQIGSEVDLDIARLRGKSAFEAMAQVGMRVHEIVSSGSFEVVRPWTYLFTFAQVDVDVASMLAPLKETCCSVIMDCHFPVMRLDRAFTKNPDDMFKLIENRDLVLANLALADAVTVPDPAWAAELAEVNPNVFYLPNLHVEDEENPTERDVSEINRFIVRLGEIAGASAAVKRTKYCRCPRCVELRDEKTTHRYLSTACLHDEHGDCQVTAVRWDGTEKKAAACKYCQAPCICDCHKEATDATS